MRRHGDGRTPVWISELGWATGGGNAYFSTTPAGQAARLTLGVPLRGPEPQRATGVSKLVWFSWRDRAGPELARLGVLLRPVPPERAAEAGLGRLPALHARHRAEPD